MPKKRSDINRCYLEPREKISRLWSNLADFKQIRNRSSLFLTDPYSNIILLYAHPPPLT